METKKLCDSTYDEQEAKRILVYGAAGSGKTSLVSSFPKPMLIFDFDQKLKPLYGLEGIEVLTYCCQEAKDALKVFTQFQKDWKEAKSMPFATFVLDSLTSLNYIALMSFCLAAGKTPEEGATLPVYKDLSGWFSTFLDLNTKGVTGYYKKNVLITAHESYNIDGESGIHSIQPLITGKTILERLPAMFEEIWYLERKGGEKDDRILHYKPFKKAIATSVWLSGTGEVSIPDIGTKPSVYEVLTKLSRKVKGG